MRRKLRQAAFATAVATLAVLALGAGVGAAANDGAVVVDETECYTYNNDLLGVYEVCLSYRSQSNVTYTPSGNVNYVINATSSYSLTAAGCQVSYVTRGHLHSLTNVPTTQEHHYSDRATEYFNCPIFGVPLKCTYYFRYHFANGKVQFYPPPEINCSPI